ncbi:hypothetical protein C1H76_1853 [Elsinoe australis]|uniref:Uncharacterized protein n=1 Tax=Elsinoe australis TaxID=40998 RepID=A0A4U7BAJ3_9PEZI|nr:hypothetical protein C1H76_1853 [Elsinoe australis]
MSATAVPCGQKRFRKRHPPFSLPKERIPLALYSEDNHQPLMPRHEVEPVSASAGWEKLPAEVRRMILNEYFSSERTRYLIHLSPFPSILGASSTIRKAGLFVFLSTARFTTFVYRHINDNKDFTLAHHRQNFSRWTTLASEAPQYKICNLRIRRIAARCVDCVVSSDGTKDKLRCTKLRNLVIDFEGSTKASVSVEFWNSLKRFGPSRVHQSHFRYRQVNVTLHHKKRVASGGALRIEMERLVDELYGERTGITIMKLMQLSVPASCFGREKYV